MALNFKIKRPGFEPGSSRSIGEETNHSANSLMLKVMFKITPTNLPPFYKIITTKPNKRQHFFHCIKNSFKNDRSCVAQNGDNEHHKVFKSVKNKILYFSSQVLHWHRVVLVSVSTIPHKHTTHTVTYLSPDTSSLCIHNKLLLAPKVRGQYSIRRFGPLF